MLKPRIKRTAGQLARIQFEVKKYVEPWAENLVSLAFSGDAAAVIQLCNVLPNGRRGWLLVAFWLAHAPVDVFRDLLRHVWQHDHDDVIDAVKKLRRLRVIFRYASFDSAGLPSIVTLYRGTSISSNGPFRTGYSWTMDIEVARGFAFRCACEGRTACLLEIKVRTNEGEVHFLDNEMGEEEIVLLEEPNVVYADARTIEKFQPIKACTDNNNSEDFSLLMVNADSSSNHPIISLPESLMIDKEYT